jgi:DNA-directed RNA polymerase sigma subunit (sigma70/sigma32)
MTLEEIGKRHQVSTVRAKQLVDSALVKLKKTLKTRETI